jgi:outer membrane protein assembly factor BamC
MNFNVKPKLTRVVVLSVALSVLAGCSLNEIVNERGRIDYKSAKRTERDQLEVPPDLVRPGQDERFNVPDRSRQRTASGFEQTRSAAATQPAESRVLPATQGVRMERAGSQRWLVVDAQAQQLWPVLREFWQEQGFIVDQETPEAGVMETGWAENRAKVPQGFIRNTLGRVFDSLYSTGERDRFRVRLERSGNQTEVYMSHRGLTEVLTSTKDSTVWTPRPNDPELEVEFLRRLMVKLGTDQQRSVAAATQVNQTGATAATQAKARLVGAQGASRLELDEGFDRAWRRVGLALERGGFTVEDRDRSAGVYFVRYVDPEIEAKGSGKPGLLDRVFSRNAAPTSAQQYRVRVAASSAAISLVDILDKDGKNINADGDRQTARKIVSLLHDQLK